MVQVHQTDFSTGSVQRNIIEVAIPMIAAQLLNLLYNGFISDGLQGRGHWH